MNDWYSQIEPEIRDLVRLLRDNGFNTTGSCGHEMWIEVDLGNNLAEAEDFARFLQEHGVDDFRIEVQLFAGTGLWVRRLQLQLGVVRGLYKHDLSEMKIAPEKEEVVNATSGLQHSHPNLWGKGIGATQGASSPSGLFVPFES